MISKNYTSIIIILLLIILLIGLFSNKYVEKVEDVPNKKIKVALCMRGGVSKQGNNTAGYLYKDAPYVNYKQCYNSIVRHIIEPNKDLYDFDVFCQCWNPDLQDELCQLYKPKMTSFEDNEIYHKEIEKHCDPEKGLTDYNGVSQALAIKKAIELKETYEKETGCKYDIVILYRYDVFLWKDILLSTYDMNKGIYVNAHVESNGDFHFVMRNDLSNKFKNLYGSSKHEMHAWIKHFVTQILGLELLMDDIVPGKNQEVLRKIRDESIESGYLSVELMDTYL